MTKHRLSGRLPSHLKFTRSITVIVERDTNGCYLASENHTTNYGWGKTRGEALSRYKQMLVADFIELCKEEQNLSQRLTDELNQMRKMITWR